MGKVMYTVEEVKTKIIKKNNLLLAGDEALLKQLPAGHWIGGTIPYFIAENGGEFSQEKIFVTELPDYVSNITIQAYDESSLQRLFLDMPQNGFSLIIIPCNSQIHYSFALNAPNYPKFATHPLIGWISGIHMKDLGHVTPKVFNGKTAEVLENSAIVMHVSLPPHKIAEIGILNIFEQDEGDTLTFAHDGFDVSDVYVNGKPLNFVDYMSKQLVDFKLPLVADYYGAKVNISFQSIDPKRKLVHLYAPVFSGIRYKLARPISNYVDSFTNQLPKELDKQVIFSCNCVLNYFYSELEGRQTSHILGPITFGEIAYQLINQTMVYLTITDLPAAH